MPKTIKEIREKFIDGSLKPSELLEFYIKNIKEKDDKNKGGINAFLEVFENKARENAKQADEIYASKEIEKINLLPLLGIPVAIKDCLMIQGHTASAGSKMLENYTSPYDATCVKLLKEAGAVIIGRTNMDEFALGGSGENSAFGKTLNPRNIERVPGGTSSGSAAAVAAEMCLIALGADTGGSVRQPASFCGVVGLKPSYGKISRYGLIAAASSLDTVGIIAHDVESVEYVLNILGKEDAMDNTSLRNANFININFVYPEGIPKYRPEVETEKREGVLCIIKDTKANKYLYLQYKTWDKESGFLSGGLEGGENLEDCVKREIREETGFVDLQNIKQIGILNTMYFNPPKNKNRNYKMNIFEVELLDQSKVTVSKDEEETRDVLFCNEDELINKISLLDFKEVIKKYLENRKLKNRNTNKKVAYPKKFMEEGKGINEEVRKNFFENLEKIKSLGYEVVDLGIEDFNLYLAAYYIVNTAEVSSNMSRFDGLRYGGGDVGEIKNYSELFAKNRAKYFGKEVKRRIMLGSYVLSHGYYDAFYGKASKLREVMKAEFRKVLADAPIIVMPTAPTTAFKFGEDKNPITLYMEDIFTVPANLMGFPGISVPTGFDSDGLPFSLQILADFGQDDIVLDFAKEFEKVK